MSSTETIDSLLAAAGLHGLTVSPMDGGAAKRVIYTAILANNDVLNEPLYSSKSCDYICFTDSETLESNFWRVVRIQRGTDFNPYMVAKALKVLGADILCGYAESLWVDGSVLLKNDPWALIDEKVGECNFAFMKHPDRTCVYQEIEACASQAKDAKSNLDTVQAELVKAGYPRDDGLISGGFIYRAHQHQVRLLFRDWMQNINRLSRRDQLTFNYTCWLANQSITYINLDIFNNEYFSVLPHFVTVVDKLKWVRKYVIVWTHEKTKRLFGYLLRGRRIQAKLLGSERENSLSE